MICFFSEDSIEKKNDLVFSEAIKDAECVYLPFAFEGKSQDLKKALFPIPEFTRHIKGTGSINIYPDIDGSSRNIPLFFKAKPVLEKLTDSEKEMVKEMGGHLLYPHIALKVAMDHMGYKIKHVEDSALILENTDEVLFFKLET